MTMTKSIGVALVAIVVIAIGGYALSNVQTKEKLSAQSEQVTDGNCYNLNGLYECVTKRPLTTATTTACAIKTPSATSTLVYAGLQINTATSTDTHWTLAKSATQYATTTVIGPSSPIVGPNRFTLSSGKLGSVFVTATSTDGVLVDGDFGNTIAPDQYLVWGVQGVDNIVSGNSTLLAGTCYAKFVY